MEDGYFKELVVLNDNIEEENDPGFLTKINKNICLPLLDISKMAEILYEKKPDRACTTVKSGSNV